MLTTNPPPTPVTEESNNKWTSADDEPLSPSLAPSAPPLVLDDKPAKEKKKYQQAVVIRSGEFEAERHFYPRVLNATIHPLVASFLMLGNMRIIARHSHLNPQISAEALEKILVHTKPQYFQWAGCDLFNVTTSNGQRQMCIVETNSCPSGQKSMPACETDENSTGGYKAVITSAFRDMVASRSDRSLGGLAVVYDKNEMEASGYAEVMADVMQEPVFYVSFYEKDPNPPVRWENPDHDARGAVMSVRDEQGVWHPIRACFRYVTQKPWNRFPIQSRTLVLNSIVSCLAGGRNKAMAARAYEFANAEWVDTGLSIRVPETIRNVTKSEIPLWLDSMGGHAVLKVPYSNAGQGVYTITNKEELKEFMEAEHHYDKFIVQSLVGNASWSSISRAGKLFHVGTIPNRRNHTYVSDLRMMVSSGPEGFRPVAIYARRARKPLLRHLSDDPTVTSWEMLGTNLSVKLSDGDWTTEAQRLLLMDRKDFNQLGLGIDDLIDAYVQTVLSVVAIDKMAQRLSANGEFDMELFSALNPDPALIDEILVRV